MEPVIGNWTVRTAASRIKRFGSVLCELGLGWEGCCAIWQKMFVPLSPTQEPTAWFLRRTWFSCLSNRTQKYLFWTGSTRQGRASVQTGNGDSGESIWRPTSVRRNGDGQPSRPVFSAGTVSTHWYPDSPSENVHTWFSKEEFLSFKSGKQRLFETDRFLAGKSHSLWNKQGKCGVVSFCRATMLLRCLCTRKRSGSMKTTSGQTIHASQKRWKIWRCSSMNRCVVCFPQQNKLGLPSVCLNSERARVCVSACVLILVDCWRNATQLLLSFWTGRLRDSCEFVQEVDGDQGERFGQWTGHTSPCFQLRRAASQKHRNSSHHAVHTTRLNSAFTSLCCHPNTFTVKLHSVTLLRAGPYGKCSDNCSDFRRIFCALCDADDLVLKVQFLGTFGLSTPVLFCRRIWFFVALACCFVKERDPSTIEILHHHTHRDEALLLLQILWCVFWRWLWDLANRSNVQQMAILNGLIWTGHLSCGQCVTGTIESSPFVCLQNQNVNCCCCCCCWAPSGSGVLFRLYVQFQLSPKEVAMHKFVMHKSVEG